MADVMLECAGKPERGLQVGGKGPDVAIPAEDHDLLLLGLVINIRLAARPDECIGFRFCQPVLSLGLFPQGFGCHALCKLRDPLDFVELALDKPCGEQAEDAGGMVLEPFERIIHGYIVKPEEMAVCLRIVRTELRRLDILIDKVGQLRGQIAGPLIRGQLPKLVDDLPGHAFSGNGGLVQVDLPIHDPARHEEFFDAVQAFFLDDQAVIHDFQHPNDAVMADNPFRYACIKAVPGKIVEPVKIELAADQLVKERPAVGT